MIQCMEYYLAFGHNDRTIKELIIKHKELHNLHIYLRSKTGKYKLEFVHVKLATHVVGGLHVRHLDASQFPQTRLKRKQTVFIIV